MPELSDNLKAIHEEFHDISSALDERRIRLWCAARAKAYNRAYGRGGVMAVHKATGVSRPRIYAGLRELEQDQKLARDCVRRPGGGRKKNMRDAAWDCWRVEGPGGTLYARRSGIVFAVDVQKYHSSSG